eukprot:7590740-Pyramimonas_sp.AAC.1
MPPPPSARAMAPVGGVPEADGNRRNLPASGPASTSSTGSYTGGGGPAGSYTGGGGPRWHAGPRSTPGGRHDTRCRIDR